MTTVSVMLVYLLGCINITLHGHKIFNMTLHGHKINNVYNLRRDQGQLLFKAIRRGPQVHFIGLRRLDCHRGKYYDIRMYMAISRASFYQLPATLNRESPQGVRTTFSWPFRR